MSQVRDQDSNPQEQKPPMKKQIKPQYQSASYPKRILPASAHRRLRNPIRAGAAKC
jgi:hypothetical protein